MTFMPHSLLAGAHPSRRWVTFARHTVSVLSVLADAAAIIFISILMGSLYHVVVYGELGRFGSFLGVGTTAAGLFVLPGLLRGEYELGHYLSFRPHLRRVFNVWNMTFVALLALAFLTRLMDDYSRASMVLFYVAGLPALLLTRYAVVHSVILGSRVELVTAQRAFLVGTGEDISGFVRRYQPWNFGLHMVGAAPLTRLELIFHARGAAHPLDRDLRQALESARTLNPDAVYIVTPWSETGTIDSFVEEFLKMPVEIHLGPERILDRFDNVRIAKHGRMASLQLTRAPLNWGERTLKRIFDVTAAAGVLIALSPLLLLTALAILLESGRPLFFLQRRYGFNQQEFRIIKFRTMTSLDDGEVVQPGAAQRSARHAARRLPAQMEYRRAAAAHQRAQGRHVAGRPAPARALAQPRIRAEDRALCAAPQRAAGHHRLGAGQRPARRDRHRRQDARRVEHDLYYIENWSLWLDLRILLWTVFSRGV